MTIRVVMVDDSSISRMVLTRILEADGDIQVVGQATNGFEALPKIHEHKPDLVTMDIDMPGPSGLETIARIMSTSPVPILVVTGERLGGPDSDVGFRAIQAGALDFMAKPAITDEPSLVRLREHVRVLAHVPVFLHVDDRVQDGRTMRAGPIDAPPFSLVAIGSGTGGPKSLGTILEALPSSFAAPVVVVQQMPEKFGPAFIKYLQGVTPLRVRSVPTLPHDLVPGEVLIGGPGAHVYFLRKGVVVAMDGAPYAGAIPSATVMFRSIAETYGKDAVGIVLSGTGTDGLEGLDALRTLGALTIAETPDSAPIPDLPAAAIKSGAAQRSLHAQMIASSLVSALSEASSKTTAPPSSNAALADMNVRLR